MLRLEVNGVTIAPPTPENSADLDEDGTTISLIHSDCFHACYCSYLRRFQSHWQCKQDLLCI